MALKWSQFVIFLGFNISRNWRRSLTVSPRASIQISKIVTRRRLQKRQSTKVRVLPSTTRHSMSWFHLREYLDHRHLLLQWACIEVALSPDWFQEIFNLPDRLGTFSLLRAEDHQLQCREDLESFNLQRVPKLKVHIPLTKSFLTKVQTQVNYQIWVTLPMVAWPQRQRILNQIWDCYKDHQRQSWQHLKAATVLIKRIWS